jgi:flagellar L-ring protein precursor FlgH
MLASTLAISGATRPAGIDAIIAGAEALENRAAASPGSLYATGAPLGDLARDLRAHRKHDLVTIIVSDRASAIAKGTTNSSRKSSARHSVGALLGPIKSSRLSDLASLSGESELQGTGETSRETMLTTTLSARVTHLLPNGVMVVEGRKEVTVNSERQLVLVRGLVRPSDVTAGNTIRSDRLAEMEITVNGKGVVGDAIKRPFFLYRILLGLLPF